MNGLIIREPWISLILSGRKTWEMRTSPTSLRGRIGLIRKGTGMVVGVADIIDSLAALDASGLAATRDLHGIPPELDEKVLGAGWTHPWVLRNVQTLRTPVDAGQKPGQVIWVSLPAAAVSAIDAQFAATPEASEPAPHRTDAREAAAVRASALAAVAASKMTASPVGQPDDVLVTLTAGAIRNSNISVRTALHLLPDGAVGGSHRNDGAPVSLTVVFDPGVTVETDIAGDKMLLRCRGAVSDFFARSGAQPGGCVLLRRQNARTLAVRLLR